MQLVYRGVSYTSTPHSVRMFETKITGTFRGQNYNIHRFINPISRPKFKLVYRGVAYTTDSLPVP